MEDADQTPFRAVDDVGVRLPFGMPLPVNDELRTIVKHMAGITRGAGLVMAANEIAADPSSALRTVLGLLKLLVFGRAQQTIDEVTATAPKLGCKSGCAWCCYQSVEATIPEAILVAAQLADPGDPRRRRVLQNAAWLRGLSERERRRTGKPCALLGEDNCCSVYDDRPLMCRAMMASDAESCHKAHLAALHGQDGPIEVFLYAQYFILGDQAALRGILRDMGLQDDLVELTQAVAAILEDPTLVDRWLNRERVFGPEMAPPLHREDVAVPAQ
ncbi:MAG: YkgJ family cysteine cluster protein [Stellaceae bacterium]